MQVPSLLLTELFHVVNVSKHGLLVTFDTFIELSTKRTTSHAIIMMNEQVSLPNEILMNIFEYNKNDFLITTIGLLNKQWRNKILMNPLIWESRKLEFTRDIQSYSIENINNFIRQCHITKFFFDFNQELIFTLYDVIKELHIGENVPVFELENCLFPEVEILTNNSTLTGGCTASWIGDMTKLTSLNGIVNIYNINLDNGPRFNQWLSYIPKTIKQMAISDYIFSEQDTIQLFKQLPLEDVELIYENHVNSSMWYNIFQIEGVSNRLKRLSVHANISNNAHNYNHITFDLNINNLKELVLVGTTVSSHIDLLYCSQHGLEHLLIHEKEVLSIDYSRIKLPKLKTLTLIGNLQMNSIVSVLSSCKQTIENLKLEFTGVLSDQSSDRFTIPESLKLPKLKKIEIIENPSSIHM
jgi:hypothetical protein